MKNYVLLFTSILIFISGCNREEPLPELGIEGVYLMVRMVEDEEMEVGDLPYENVYWFFADRTFQKARLMDGELLEAMGTFSDVTISGSDDAGVQAFELSFTTGNELIEGCHIDREILIQTTDSELLHEGASCGEPDIYYNKADFGGE